MATILPGTRTGMVVLGFIIKEGEELKCVCRSARKRKSVKPEIRQLMGAAVGCAALLVVTRET